MLQRNNTVKAKDATKLSCSVNHHSPTTSTYFTFRKPGDLLTMTVGEDTYFYVQNIRGDVVALMDSQGNQIASYSYDTWGVPTISNPSNLPNPFLYQGSYATFYDDEFGMYGMGARHYNPKTMRFISRDLNHGTLTNTMSQNLYIYCYNNPLGFKDPSGFSPYYDSRNLLDLRAMFQPPGGGSTNPRPNGQTDVNEQARNDAYEAWLKATGKSKSGPVWEEFLNLWNQASKVAEKMKKYTKDDYNQYDQEIAFWCIVWNDKAKLGLSGDGLVRMCDWIKGICYLETHMNPNANGDGIMQLEYGTMEKMSNSLSKEAYGYLSDEWVKNHRKKDANGNWVSDLKNVNDALYASIGTWVANLSSNQSDSPSEWNGIKKLDTWLAERANKDAKGNITSYDPARTDGRRFRLATSSYGPGNETRWATYNRNHQNVAILRSSGEDMGQIYGKAIEIFVETGRSPYSYQNEGAKDDGESSKSMHRLP